MVKYATPTPTAEEDNSPSTILSALAGIGSGLFKIPEGFVSLGATLIDLGAGTDKAAEVEEFFAKINPFDEYAQETTAGKITELIVNIGVPGGIAFKAGNTLAKNALMARKADKYLDLGGDTAKAIQKKLKGQKINRIEKGLVDDAFSTKATGLEKTGAFATASGLGGIAEGMAVANVEEAGSFGDLIGGPTALTRDTETPEDELLNRLRFGMEGAAFTGILGGAGATIKRLRSQKDKGRVANGKFNKFLDKWVSGSLRARGLKTQPVFDGLNKVRGLRDADINVAENAAFDLDKLINKLFPTYKRLTNNADTVAQMKQLKSDMNKTLFAGSQKGKLEPKYYDFELNEAGRKSGKTIEEISGNKNLKNKLTKPGFSVRFGKINKKIENDFRDKIKKLGGDKTIQDEMLFNFNGIRNYWGDMFSVYGRRLDKKALKTFKDNFERKVTDWLDSGLEIFKNDPIRGVKKYAPANQLIKETARQFQAIAKKSDIKLDDETAEQMVNNTWKSAKVEQGFKLKSPSDPYFKLPDFFVSRSFAKRAADRDLKLPVQSQLSDVPDKIIKVDGLSINRRDVIKKLLGKTDDPMSSILIGTNKLATIIRRNQVYDDLLRASNKQKKVYDDWLKAGGRNSGKAEPEAPIFVDSEQEAAKYFGAGLEPGETTVLRFDSNLDRNATIKPVDAVEEARLKAEAKMKATKPGRRRTGKLGTAAKAVELKSLNPLENKIALTGNVKGLMGTDKFQLGTGMASQIYANTILFPKATSQMAKTVLAPFTHARNFLSAAAFAGANGLIPLKDTEAVKQAFRALQAPVYGARKNNELYQKLVRLGVVNSQVELGDLQRLLQDTTIDLSGMRSLNGLLNKLSKVRRMSQDLYTAEDDFWKIYSWFGESKRLENSYRAAGLQFGQTFTDVSGKQRIFNKEFIEEEAANLVKNQIPNYAFVNEFVKGIRVLPVGNFVAFPAEILRTGTNIVARALDEINYTIKVKGVDVKPLKAVGYTRLAGMAVTTSALPYAAVAAGQMLYDVSKDELDAMRRYVADWAKNSTLIPSRDKDGKLEYIDFSHMNAYDTLTRPIQTVLNAVQAGEQDKDGILGDFILGLIESTKELGQPFISESIWTEALQDVAPILGRGGRTIEGRQIYNPNPDIDPYGTQFVKSIKHLFEAQAPFNWKQLRRLGISMKPIDDVRKFDKRGEEYEFGNEALGIVGLRSVKVDPEKSLTYKISNFKKGKREAKGLFTRATLKGGPVSPEEVVDAYINANKALFRVNREMYKDIEAAKILDIDEDKLVETFVNRGERKDFAALNDGIFRPYTVSGEVASLFDRISTNLGVPNPFDLAGDAIGAIREILSETPITLDVFPDLPNPFRNLPLPKLLPNNQGSIPTNVQNAASIIGGQNISIPNIVTQAQTFDNLYSEDDLGKAYLQKQIQKNRRTV